MSDQPRPPRPPKPKERDPYDYEAIFEEEDAPSVSPIKQVPKRILSRAGVAVVLVIVLLVSVIQIKGQINPGKQGGEINIEVVSGATFNSVATQLDAKRVVPSAFWLKMWAKLHGGAPGVKAGEYSFNLNSSDSAALAVLNKGPKPSTDRLVIPEGFRLAQIAQRVGELPGMSTQKFYALATGGTIRSDYEPADSSNLEGLLYPDTYLLSSSDNEQTLLQRMVNEFDNEAKVLNLDASAASIGHTPYETIIIASMIESEAKVPDDRGKISQVIENRLFRPMNLQIDATVLYALNNTKQTLSKNDLLVKSPYNTYAVAGLPPAPISSPGAPSLKAALQPTPGPWLYYVVTGADGSHSFSTTLDDQNKNIALAKQRGLR